MDPLRKVKPGDAFAISAKAYNAFVDAARAAKGVPDADVRGGRADRRDPLTVLIRNESGEDLPQGGVLGLDRPLIDPDDNEREFQSRVTFVGAAIAEGDDYAGRFAIACEPIPQDTIGRAIIHGTTPALVIVDDEDHGHADTLPGEDKLHSTFTGAARILWKQPGTGEKLAVLDLRPAGRDHFSAMLGQAHPIDGHAFGWLYEWQEVRLDANPASGTFGRYLPPLGGLSSGIAEQRLAFNRFEALLLGSPEAFEGSQGYVGMEACGIPAALRHCPPRRIAMPTLRPVPAGLVVEIRAERTLQGRTRFVFEALNHVELIDTNLGGAA